MTATEFMSGKREIFGIGKESSYGGAVSPTIRLGINAEFTPNNENDWQETRGAGTDTLEQTYQIGNKTVGGTLKFVPNDWMMLVFAIGKTTNTGSAPTTHTFGNNTDFSLYSFTLERAIQATTDRVRTYEGCQCNRFTIEWAASASTGGMGNFITCSMDLMAENVTNGTSTTDLVAPTYAGWQARNVVLTLNTTAKANLIRGRIVIDNHLSDGRYAYYSANSRYKGESQPQYRTTTGEFVLHYTDDTEFDFFDAGTVIGGTNTIVFNRGTNDTLTGTFTNLRIVSASDPTTLDGFNQVTLRWIADSVAWVCVDTNNQTYIV